MALDIQKYAHPQYLSMLPDYVKIRDCYAGERCIKDKGEAYLPKLGGQSQADYKNYLGRALFFPITGKTTSTLTGLATMRPPKSTYPELLADYFVDTNNGYQFTELYTSVFNEVILMGRYGLLLDAEAAPASSPIKIVPYCAESIINWTIDGRGMFTMLLLKEVRVKEISQFERQQETVFRHCWVADGVYYTQILNEDLEPAENPVLMPMFSGSTIDYVPFVIIGSAGVHAYPDKPPMLDITTINLSHYLTSADLEWGRHIVGLPTPVVTGADSSSSLKIGGTSAWVLPMPESKAFYLEFQGQGLQSLEKAMTEKIGLMASLSARLIDSSSKGSEAAETVRLRYMSESATLTHIIGSVEAGLILLFNMLAQLAKVQGDVQITFSREILGQTVTYKDLKSLLEVYMAGAMSKESFLYNLRRLDAVDPTRSDSEELSAIKDPPPPTNPANTGLPGNTSR